MSSLIYKRNISERSLLSELNMDLAITIGKKLSELQTMKIDFPKLIQTAAERLIQKPKYSRNQVLMSEVVDKANQIYPKMGILKAPLEESLALWRATIIYKTQIALLKAFGWEAREVSSNDFPYPMNCNQRIPVELLSCFEYALFRAGVDEAYPVTWRGPDLPNLLTKSWGYKTVSKEESRPGDLVLYFDDEGVPTHMGIRYKDKVLSKPGNEQMFVFAHDLDEAFSCYGKEVRFYRRSILD